MSGVINRAERIVDSPIGDLLTGSISDLGWNSLWIVRRQRRQTRIWRGTGGVMFRRFSLLAFRDASQASFLHLLLERFYPRGGGFLRHAIRPLLGQMRLVLARRGHRLRAPPRKPLARCPQQTHATMRASMGSASAYTLG